MAVDWWRARMSLAGLSLETRTSRTGCEGASFAICWVTCWKFEIRDAVRAAGGISTDVSIVW